jgi:hypothetical protein
MHPNTIPDTGPVALSLVRLFPVSWRIAAHRCCKPVTHIGVIIGYPALIKAADSRAPVFNERVPPR